MSWLSTGELLLLAAAASCFTVYGSVLAYLWIHRKSQRKQWRLRNSDIVFGFFHPYCDSGGGGERVLWIAVHGLLTSSNLLRNNGKVVIYTGDSDKSKATILSNVQRKFGVEFDKSAEEKLHFVYIRSRTLLEAKWYPVATMLFQCLGSMLVGLECIFACVPDIYCDTTGGPFTYVVVRMLTSAKILAYVHYPVISTDMLQKVREQRPSYNNNNAVAGSVTISSLKLFYYQLFAILYGYIGELAHSAVVNSSWTRDHIAQLWGWAQSKDEAIPDENLLTNGSTNTILYSGSYSGNRRLSLVYPPCNTTHLHKIALPRTVFKNKTMYILSIGQFRPEKDHLLQLRTLKAVKDRSSKYTFLKLVVIGSTRNAEDEILLQNLQEEAGRLGLACQVETEYTDCSLKGDTYSDATIDSDVLFVVNQPYQVLVDWMAKGHIGIHTMWNEHFGISVVEMMAAGLVIVAHKSGGPLMDIVSGTGRETSSTSSDVSDSSIGYLAESVEEYADAIVSIVDNYDKAERISLQNHARESTLRFSDEIFVTKMVYEFEYMVKLLKKNRRN